MDNKNGVKVTYIETQFVTSDAAGFKSLVQRLTGKPSGAAAAPAHQLHRPRPRHADGRSAATTGPSGYRMPATAGPVSAAANDAGTRSSSYLIPATAGPVGVAANDARTATAHANSGAAQSSCLDELHGLCDYTELFTVVGASEQQRHGSYSGFPY
ncbi:hypothetical protein CFC21_088927 [Triticum aestivum]|uniref:VQ domain-containing protein n=3 Tax=Triticum TaxID=4564 RepID=A0A9R1BCV1_TRITD|nr:hypothetical protein CFC21_088927 [Triticum aestivum]VAI60008.1 unnamed protein product [Triticum turgidum subsp. durum]